MQRTGFQTTFKKNRHLSKPNQIRFRPNIKYMIRFGNNTLFYHYLQY